MLYQLQRKGSWTGKWENAGEPVNDAKLEAALAALRRWPEDEVRAVALGTTEPLGFRRYRVGLYSYVILFGEVEVWAASVEDAERIGVEIDRRALPVAAGSYSPVEEHFRTEACAEPWPELDWEMSHAYRSKEKKP